MSKIHIETYRGVDITYDDSNEKFVCEMVMEDNYKQTNRGKLKDIRTEIDKFIKANAQFKPFKVMIFSAGYTKGVDKKIFNGVVDIYNAIGVRKDGALIVEDKEGRKKYIGVSDWGTSKYEIGEFQPALFDIEREWKEHEAIWISKQKELEERAKQYIVSINWDELVTPFANAQAE